MRLPPAVKTALGPAGNEIEKYLEVFNTTNNFKLLADCSKSTQRNAAGLGLVKIKQNKKQLI